MDEKTIAVARRAVACRHWRWMEGMRVRVLGAPAAEHACHTVCGVEAGEPVLWVGVGSDRCWVAMPVDPRLLDVLPDIHDPATQGCLLELVKRNSGGRLVQVFSDYPDHWEHQWIPLSEDDRLGGCPWNNAGHPTYGEALVSALETLS